MWRHRRWGCEERFRKEENKWISDNFTLVTELFNKFVFNRFIWFPLHCRYKQNIFNPPRNSHKKLPYKPEKSERSHTRLVYILFFFFLQNLWCHIPWIFGCRILSRHIVVQCNKDTSYRTGCLQEKFKVSINSISFKGDSYSALISKLN